MATADYLARVLLGPDGPPVGTCWQVTPGVFVTAAHVLADIGADQDGAVVALDALDPLGPTGSAIVARRDVDHDLAVLTSDHYRLPASASALMSTDRQPTGQPVCLSGVADVPGATQAHRHLDALGTLRGGTVVADGTRWGRMACGDVMRGMSGAPVRRVTDDAVVGIVSGRYNTTDGWLRDSVWLARTEDLHSLLVGLCDVAVGYDEAVDRRRAHDSVGVIRRAAAERYAKLVMPHSREDYLVPIDHLYVTRSVQPITIGAARRGAGMGYVDEQAPIPEQELAAHRFVVVGNPGAGKTTFIRHLMYQLSQDTADPPIAPLVIDMKDHQTPPESFAEAMVERLRITTQTDVTGDVIGDVLTLGLATVVFDGLDEISEIDQRRLTVDAINAFTARYPRVRVVVTTREEGYLAARLDPDLFPVFRLPDFTDEQMERYVRQWFAVAGSQSDHRSDSELAERFLQDSEHVRDLRTNPLMLSLLCLIYKYEGYIPDNRPDAYEQCAELMFERWDMVRQVPIPISRTAKTKYLVQELGYYFFNRDSTLGGETETKLRAIVTDYFERNIVGGVASARQQAVAFLDYCAGRAWLLSPVGTSDRGERLFGFTHRTFMEYYAARFIVRRCRDASMLVTMIRPILTLGTSEVVPQIAIQQFDDKNDRGADDCLTALLTDGAEVSPEGHRRFIDFALRSLSYLRPAADTMSRMFEVALVEFGRNLDVSLAALLLGIPEDISQLLAKDCTSFATRGRAATAVARAERASAQDYGPSGTDAQVTSHVHVAPAGPSPLRVGAAVLGVLLDSVTPDLRARRIAEQLQLSSTALAGYLAVGFPKVARWQVAVATELHRRGLLPTVHYVAALGERCLVSLPLDDSIVQEEVPGRLVELLKEFFIGETEHPDLRAMLKCVESAPSAVRPMNPAVVSAVLDSTGSTGVERGGTVQAGGNFNERVLDQHFSPRGGAADARGLRMVYLAAMCAAFDYQQAGAALHTSVGWERVALAMPALYGYLMSGSNPQAMSWLGRSVLDVTRHAMVAAVLRYVEETTDNRDWRALFARWANARVLCVSGDPR